MTEKGHKGHPDLAEILKYGTVWDTLLVTQGAASKCPYVIRIPPSEGRLA